MRASGATCGSQAYRPVAALAYDGRLHQAATAHSQDMAARNYFSHTGADGSSPGQRVSAAGYTWNAVGENIAAGYGTVAAVMAGWASSPGHCANIMSPNYTQLGIACVSGGGSSTFRNYWTMNLARPR